MWRTGLIIGSLLTASHAAACELPMAPRIDGLDPGLFLLVGEVEGIVGPVASERVEGEAFGVRVRVIENLHAPTTPGTIVDVFEFDMSGACEAIGQSRTAVSTALPPGTTVRVVAKASERLPAAPLASPTRLEAGPYNLRAFISPVYRDEPVQAAFAAVHDFATPIDIARYERVDPTRFGWAWFDGMLEFELHKEIVRLERAADSTEREAILSRLARYPRQDDLDLRTLTARYGRGVTTP